MGIQDLTEDLQRRQGGLRFSEVVRATDFRIGHPDGDLADHAVRAFAMNGASLAPWTRTEDPQLLAGKWMPAVVDGDDT